MRIHPHTHPPATPWPAACREHLGEWPGPIVEEESGEVRPAALRALPCAASILPACLAWHHEPACYLPACPCLASPSPHPHLTPTTTHHHHPPPPPTFPPTHGRPACLLHYPVLQVLGYHRGFWFHTLGQRKGVPLSGGPW